MQHLRRSGEPALSGESALGGGRAEPGSGVRGETDATLAFAAAGGIGALVGLIGFWGRVTPLWGGWSMGAVAAIVAGASALLVAWIAYWRARRAPGQRWRLALPSWLFIIDTASVAVVHAALAMVLTVAVFALFQRSFVGLEADTFMAVVGVGLPAGLAAYWTAVSCQGITTRRLSGCS